MNPAPLFELVCIIESLWLMHLSHYTKYYRSANMIAGEYACPATLALSQPETKHKRDCVESVEGILLVGYRILSTALG